jgi:hypothetical protein
MTIIPARELMAVTEYAPNHQSSDFYVRMNSIRIKIDIIVTTSNRDDDDDDDDDRTDNDETCRDVNHSS